jgi:hypothetical protein
MCRTESVDYSFSGGQATPDWLFTRTNCCFQFRATWIQLTFLSQVTATRFTLCDAAKAPDGSRPVGFYKHTVSVHHTRETGVHIQPLRLRSSAYFNCNVRLRSILMLPSPTEWVTGDVPPGGGGGRARGCMFMVVSCGRPHRQPPPPGMP